MLVNIEPKSQKLVLVLTFFVSMTKISKEIDSKASKNSKLQWVLSIYYSTRFGEFIHKPLIDSNRRVHVILPKFASKLDFRICKINMSAQKSDGSRLKTCEIKIALFQIDHKDGKLRYFQKTLIG